MAMRDFRDRGLFSGRKLAAADHGREEQRTDKVREETTEGSEARWSVIDGGLGINGEEEWRMDDDE
jgi:hypothetical protein